MHAYNKKTLSIDFDIEELDKSCHIVVDDEIIDELLIRQQSGDALVLDKDDNLIFVRWTTDKYKTWNPKKNAFVYVKNYHELALIDANSEKAQRLGSAEQNILMLERKVRLGMATDEEIELLRQWEIYSVKLSDIDTSFAPDIDWPQKP
ncbi:tail fiber assembly protein [Providencia sp. PROV200]|uniref:tail fiber assembly protein n=1 Tax=Providencia sp. PROV200 TaxID=2936794 RepID=UPI003CF62E3A